MTGSFLSCFFLSTWRKETKDKFCPSLCHSDRDVGVFGLTRSEVMFWDGLAVGLSKKGSGELNVLAKPLPQCANKNFRLTFCKELSLNSADVATFISFIGWWVRDCQSKHVPGTDNLLISSGMLFRVSSFIFETCNTLLFSDAFSKGALIPNHSQWIFPQQLRNKSNLLVQKNFIEFRQSTQKTWLRAANILGKFFNDPPFNFFRNLTNILFSHPRIRCVLWMIAPYIFWCFLSKLPLTFRSSMLPWFRGKTLLAVEDWSQFYS